MVVTQFLLSCFVVPFVYGLILFVPDVLYGFDYFFEGKDTF
jgi:hypothetical protein